jgi:DnaJ-class molecular chaperone
MAESSICPSCKNKRKVICSCCSGKGWVEVSQYPPHLQKLYVCVDCAGSGEVPCPRCSPPEKKIRESDVQLGEVRPRFGRA